MKSLILGNWKMKVNTLEDVHHLAKGYESIAEKNKDVDIAMGVSYPFLATLKEYVRENLAVMAQDVFWEESGSYTGMVSPAQLQSIGVQYCIVGHSERRKFGETDDTVAKKIQALAKMHITPVVCIGEHERDETNSHFNYVRKQLETILGQQQDNHIEQCIIAYEPIWAISDNANGRVCTEKQCYEMIEHIKGTLENLGKPQPSRYIYGGSVNKENSKGYLQEGGVTGLLPGKASIDIDQMKTIVEHAKV